MANNERIYKIVINGITESITQMDVLLSKLTDLDKRLGEITKQGVKIKIGKGDVDFDKTQLEDGVKTLASMRRELGQLKKELANTELGTDQWNKLRDRVLATNNEVKAIEQSYGVFTRNVGNYTNSFLAAFDKFPASVKETLSGLQSFNSEAATLKQQIRSVTNSMDELTAQGKGESETYQALTQVLGKLNEKQKDFNDSVEDAKDRTNGLKDVTEVFESMTGAMQLAAGAASLFGTESEDAVKAIKKMQALQSIANGLKSLQTALQRNGALWKVWQKALSASEKIIRLFPSSLKGTAAGLQATATGMNATATATRGATAAMNGLKVAIASTGIGLLVVGVGALVSKLMELADWGEKAKKALEGSVSFGDNAFDREVNDLDRQLSLGLITPLEYAQKKLMESRARIVNELDTFWEAFVQETNDWLSTLGNQFSGDDEAMERIRYWMVEVGGMFGSFSLENEDFGLDKLDELKSKIATIDYLIETTFYFDIPESIKESMTRLKEFINQTADMIVDVEVATKEAEKTRREAEEKARQEAQENADKRFAIEQQLERNRLSLYKGTLTERLGLLRLEMESEIREAKKSGIKVHEQLAEIDRMYRKRLEDETKTWLNESADAYNAAVNERMKSENALISNMVDQLRAQYTYLNNNVFANNTNTNFVSNIIENFYNPDESYPQLIEDEQKYLQAIKTYRDGAYQDLLSAQKEYQTELYNQQVYEETESFNRKKEELESEIALAKQMLPQLSSLEKNELMAKQDELEMLVQTHNNTLENLEKQKNLAIAQINEEADNERLASQAEMQNKYLASLSNWLGSIQDKMSSVQENNLNEWRILNIVAYRKDLDTMRAETEQLITYLKKKKVDIEASFNAGDIDFDTYVDGISEVNDQIKEANDVLKENDKKVSESVGDFLDSISNYVQSAIQGYTQVAGALFDKFNSDLDKQMDKLEDENDRLSDILDKQKDIIEKHNSNIEDIEGKLATARGDRRDQLIDALNEEKLARERAYAEEQRIEKQKEANERKMRDLEYKQKVQQWKQQIHQAAASTALAVTNALATQPFVPVGIAMGSLAAALGGVQIGVISSNKPTRYKKGGLLEGKSHEQGGIKVAGFDKPIELEGNEYVINKRTTQYNLPLLEFINHSKKRIDVADLIDFYYSNHSNGSTSPKSKYAEGGQLPVPQVVDIGNNTQHIFVDMDDTPIVVSVEEITQVQEHLHQVKTLAGAI